MSHLMLVAGFVGVIVALYYVSVSIFLAAVIVFWLSDVAAAVEEWER